MAPLTNVLLVSAIATGVAFSPAGTIASRPAVAVPKTVAFESFGFDFAEDQAENAPEQLLGEADVLPRREELSPGGQHLVRAWVAVAFRVDPDVGVVMVLVGEMELLQNI